MVSVVIPIYKVEEYLRECVDSVINQTYTDLEIILVDDGSPDNCGKICDEYASKDSRVVVIHKENGGLSDARNAGLAIAHGEYTYFLDSDDYIELDAISKMLVVAEKEHADIVFFKCIEFSEDPSIPVYDIDIRYEYPTAPGGEILRKRADNKEMWHSIWLHFYRTAFLVEEGLLFEKGMLYEDTLFSGIAYARAKRVSVLNEALHHYRKRKGSIMNVKPKKKNLSSFFTGIKGLSKEKERYQEGSSEQGALDAMIVYVAGAYMEMYCDADREVRKGSKEERRVIRNELKRVKTRDCRKQIVKYEFPRLWLLYHGIKKRIKKQ